MKHHNVAKNFWDLYLRKNDKVLLYTTLLHEKKVVFHREYVPNDSLVPGRGDFASMRAIWADQSDKLPAKIKPGQIWQATLCGTSQRPVVNKRHNYTVRCFFKDFELLQNVTEIQLPADKYWFNYTKDLDQLQVGNFMLLKVSDLRGKKEFDPVDQGWKKYFFNPIFLPAEAIVGEEWLCRIESVTTVNTQQSFYRVIPVQRYKQRRFNIDVVKQICNMSVYSGDVQICSKKIEARFRTRMFRSTDGNQIITRHEVYVNPDLNDGQGLLTTKEECISKDLWVKNHHDINPRINWARAVKKFPLLQE